MRKITICTIIINWAASIIAVATSISSPEGLIPGLVFHGEIPFQTDTPVTPGGTNNPSSFFPSNDDDSIELPSSLKSLQVTARIIDGIAEVTMVQQFLTPEFFPDKFELKEAAYQVPLDELAAVTEFRAEIDNRIIEAVVKEKEEARKDFEEALQDGKSAFLAVQSRADIFRISVGNVPKGKLVKVTLVYITSLEAIDGDTVRFVFPNDLVERYDPVDNSEEPILDGEDFMEKGISIKLDISMATDITEIISLTHEIEIERVQNRTGHALVEVTDENIQKSDLAVLITTASTYEPMVYIESFIDQGTTAVMLSIVPNISQELLSTDTKLEFVFIIDRSGSMAGENMEKTRKAMFLILDKIPDASIFNILGFGSTFDVLFDEGSQSISDDTARTRANEYITQMDADFGGTEILDPLKYVLGGDDMPAVSTYDRITIVMTDGAVSNTGDTIEYVRNNNSNGRVFSLGIGDHVSALLVRGIARVGKGTAEFVDGDSLDAIKDAVERQMQIASNPGLSNVRIDWGNSDETSGSQAPYLTPNLINRKRFLMFYILDGESSFPETIRVSSDIINTKNTIEYEVTSDLFLDISKQSSDSLGNALIHKMACRSLIRDLEEGGSKMHWDGVSSNEEIENEIARLGIKYEIASSQTSFVAVDNEGWSENIGSAIDDKESQHSRTFSQGRASSCHSLRTMVNILCTILMTLLVLVF